jgi:hypothetical protein
VVSAEVEDAYTAPPDANDARPVPPFVVARVPARVTAPAVAELKACSPVVPALQRGHAVRRARRHLHIVTAVPGNDGALPTPRSRLSLGLLRQSSQTAELRLR